MRIITIFIISLIALSHATGQIGYYDNSPAQQPVVDTYVSPDWNYIYKAAETIRARQLQNAKYIDNLITWIYELKTQTDEEEFLDAMTWYYNFLRDNEAEMSYSGIRKVEMAIRKKIDEYNTRLKQEYDPKIYWEQGNEEWKKQNYDGAIQNYTRVIELSPTFVEAYVFRGLSYRYVGNLTNAITDFNKAIELDSENFSLYGLRGWTKYFQDDLYGAMRDFNKQLEIDVYSAEAFFNRGCVKSKLEDRRGSIVDYNKAIALKPTHSMAHNNLGWSQHLLKNNSEALINIDKAVILDSENYVAYDSRAVLKFEMKEYVECIGDCNSAIGLNPKYQNPYLYRGRAKYRLGKKQDACLDWSKAGELGHTEAYDYISKYCND